MIDIVHIANVGTGPLNDPILLILAHILSTGYPETATVLCYCEAMLAFKTSLSLRIGTPGLGHSHKHARFETQAKAASRCKAGPRVGDAVTATFDMLILHSFCVHLLPKTTPQTLG